MKTARIAQITAIFLGIALVPGCHLDHSEASPRQDESPPIWSADAVTTPLGLRRLRPGDEASVALPLTFNPAPGAMPKVLADIGVTATLDASSLVLNASREAAGYGVVVLPGTNPLALAVRVDPQPIVEFTYAPPAGSAPENVFVAGSFNGWSSGKDRLVPGDDAVYRLELAVEPGTHSYKFVVDGNWMPDPANPEQDSTGYGNSILRVEGEKLEELDFLIATPEMPLAGEFGGFLADLRAGSETLRPDSVVLVSNNTLLDPTEYKVDPATGWVRLNPREWNAENHVVVMATTTTGRIGSAAAFFTYKAAPRSPRDEILYFAFTDRFADGDLSINHPADDPEIMPLANYIGGDWAGIRQKIEEGYFDRLGVTSIWLSPVNQNTQKVERESVPPGDVYTSYHGYWPTSWTGTNEQFGTMDDLRSLVDSAHERHIAVLLDFVANHVHEDHPVYREHPEWAVPLELPDGTNNIRKFDEHPLTTWFDTFLPTLNYEKNLEIRGIMEENAVYWLEETGADGFRHDAVKHIPVPFWQGLTKRLYETYGDRHIYQVGETISGRDTVSRFLGPDLLTGQFDFPDYFTLRGVLGLDEGSMEDLAESQRQNELFYPPYSIMSPLIGNHDVSRFMAFADGDLPPGTDEKEVALTTPPQVDDPASYRKLQLAFAYILTTPGMPLIYYGDEIGMTGAHDPDNRRPMIWENWKAPQQATFDAVSALTRARAESIALRRGNVQVLHADKERFVFARIAPEETVIVALSRNPDTQSVTVVLPRHWGDVVSVEPLVTGGVTHRLEEGRLRLDGGAHAYGVWRVRF